MNVEMNMRRACKPKPDISRLRVIYNTFSVFVCFVLVFWLIYGDLLNSQFRESYQFDLNLENI